MRRPTALEAIVRGSCCLLGGLLGLSVGRLLMSQGVLSESINLVYLTMVGLLLGYLLSSPLVKGAERLLGWWSRQAPDAILAAGLGMTAALVLSVLLNSVLERIPGFSWQLSLLMTLILTVAASWFFVANRQLLAWALPSTSGGARARGAARSNPLLTVIDTSALIDGRILPVTETHFLSGRILLPHVVMYELQHIADAADSSRRRRGRRGLEILEALEKKLGSELELVHDSLGDEAVDSKLVKICLERQARLLTTDYNLARVASIGGVDVLNLNELANALRPTFATGETLSVHITKAGREAGQGLAYLDDGTMVVVEGAANLVGKKVTAAVTSHLQTNVGRMIFAQLES